MNKQEKYDLLQQAYTTKDVKDDREKITVISDELPKEMHDAIRDIQFKLNDETSTFELDYEIMSDACGCVGDVPLDKLSEADFYETECASVYTSTRLSYLNRYNESDISDISKEYGVDIQTACAVWYDRMVAQACSMIRDYILE